MFNAIYSSDYRESRTNLIYDVLIKNVGGGAATPSPSQPGSNTHTHTRRKHCNTHFRKVSKKEKIGEMFSLPFFLKLSRVLRPDTEPEPCFYRFMKHMNCRLSGTIPATIYCQICFPVKKTRLWCCKFAMRCIFKSSTREKHGFFFPRSDLIKQSDAASFRCGSKPAWLCPFVCFI